MIVGRAALEMKGNLRGGDPVTDKQHFQPVDGNFLVYQLGTFDGNS